MSESRATWIFVVTAVGLLALLAVQVDRPGGGTALGRVVHVVTAPVVGGVLRVARAVSDTWRGYVALVGVRRERDALAARVRRLEAERARWRELELENARLRELVDLRHAAAFDGALATRVLSELASDPLRRALIVDRGRADGVGADWVAVARGALVGRVVETTRHTATVLLVVDPTSDVGVRHQESRFAGILEGRNRGPARIAFLKYVPRDQPIAVGDVVVTSGVDGVFPPGLLVGRVVALATDDDEPLTWSARVEIAVEPAAVEELLLLPPVAASGATVSTP